MLNVIRAGLLLSLVVVLTGCPSAGNFNRAFEKPAASAKSAAEVVQAAEKDVLAIRALGARGQVASLPSLMCWPEKGPDLTNAGLTVFVDALETVKGVAEAPDDTSYAGYIRKFSENAEALNRDFAKEAEEGRAKIELKRTRCESLATADLNSGTTLSDGAIPGTAALGESLAPILALDALFKSVLAQAEKAQRAAAVRETVKKLLPELEKAHASLKAAPAKDAGIFVLYPPKMSGEAVNMNKTSLGSAVTLRRWMAAVKVDAGWNGLQGCRNTVPSTCIRNIEKRKAGDEFAQSVIDYRALATIDTDKLLDQLGKAIEAASKADKPSLADVIDAIVSIGGALDGINGKYEDYRKTQD